MSGGGGWVGGGLVFKIVFKIEDIHTFLLLIFVLIFFFVLFWNGILFSFSRTEDLTLNVRD